MTESKQTLSEPGTSGDDLWPPRSYYPGVEKLKSLIGEQIYIVEVTVGDINAGIRHTGKAYRLLAVIDYPQADHKTGLLPHNIIIDDGRGINLGRIVQISTGTAFNPDEQNIAFDNRGLLDDIFPHWIRLSRTTLAQTSKCLLASLLGKPDPGQQQADMKTHKPAARMSAPPGEKP
jgi:hypothetical protein